VSTLQNTRFRLAECRTETAVSRAFLEQCIAKHLKGELGTEEASMAKWWCTEMQFRVTDACLQMFGGYGYMKEYPISRLWADARVQRIYGGTTEVMKEIVARGMFRSR
jgi:alkylation response protein AidB-like acyl-CoA dehydrogenase